MRERRERIARDPGLMEPERIEIRERLQALERRVVQRNIRLHRLAENQLLERRRGCEQRQRLRHHGRRLSIPQPSVDIEFLQMRQRGQPGQLVLQGARPESHADQIEGVDTEVCAWEGGEIADRSLLTFQNYPTAEPQGPFGDDPVRRCLGCSSESEGQGDN